MGRNGKILLIIALAVAFVFCMAMAAGENGEKEKAPEAPQDPATPEAQEETHTESVALDRAFMTMPAGQTLKVEATVSPAGSADRVEWSTSDSAVATVSQTGHVTARSPGTATITAESGGHSASLQVTVFKGVTQGERNAAQSAREYVALMSFSEEGLYGQLLYEKYTEEEARYGVEHCGADWYGEAEESAREYLGLMTFSKEGLYDQLIYEGFTEDQARKAVDKVYA